MANPEYFECFMNGRIHHRRHDSKEWKVGYAPTSADALRIRKTTRYEPPKPNSVSVHSGFDVGSGGDQTVYYTPDSFSDTSSSSDVSGGGGSFDGGGASGDY